MGESTLKGETDEGKLRLEVFRLIDGTSLFTLDSSVNKGNNTSVYQH